MDSVFFSEAIFSKIEDKSELKGALSIFCDLGSHLLTDGVSTWLPEDPYLMVAGDEHQLYQVLFEFGEDYGINIEDATNVTRIVDRSSNYRLGIDDSLRASGVNGAPEQLACYGSVFAARAELLAGVGEGTTYLPGACNLQHNAGGQRNFYLVTQSSDVVSLYRHHLTTNLRTQGVFSAYAKKAFPQLMILDGVKPEDLGLDLGVHAESVVNHLAYLNDHCIDDFDACGWDLYRAQQRASAQLVNFSDESSLTKADHKKMREREVQCTLDGERKTLVCSLHTKIEPQCGRIHFSIERTRVGRVIVVGKMHHHLPI